MKDLLREYERILVANGISTDQITDIRIDIPGLAGEHLGSDCFLVTLTFQDPATPQRHLFVKKVSANPPDFFKDVGLFKKESSFVNLLLPELRAAHAHARFKQPLDFFPHYLHADEERIVMVNLTKPNGIGSPYASVSKLIKLDLGYVKYVLDKLALFHSLTYVDQGTSRSQSQLAHRDAYLSRYPFLRERLYVEGKEAFNIAYDNLIRTRIAVLRAATAKMDTGGDDEHQKAIQFLEKGLGTVFGHVLGAISHRSQHIFYVVNHGDCWITNLLFKTDPKTGELLHHVFLDFQLMRLGSPSLDLAYFLFTSTRPSVLRNNWKQLLQFYYDRLRENVELQGKGFTHTFEDLLTDFRLKFRFGFWLNMTFFTGFDIFPHIDMQKVETDVEDTGLGQQIAVWIEANPKRAQELASEILVLVDTFNEIVGMGE